LIDKILKDDDLSIVQKIFVVQTLNDIEPTDTELVNSIIYLIDKFDWRFKINKNYHLVSFGPELATSTPNIRSKDLILKNINIYNINSIINIIYKYIIGSNGWLPLSQHKYLNLLNLDGEPSYLDLSEVSSSNLNKIKYLDGLTKIDHLLSKCSKANTIAVRKNLNFLKLSTDSPSSIKKALSEDKSQKKTIRSDKIVNHLKNRMEGYHQSIGCASYFKQDWFKYGVISVKRMRRYVDPGMIIKAIDWFFDDGFWVDKIDSMEKVERHYNKFAAQNQKTVASGSNLISKRLGELGGD
jgi:hypothetical protein